MNQIVLDPDRWTDAAPTRVRLHEPSRFRWTATTVLQLGEAGVFGNRRVELIDGEVFEMPGEGDLHQGLRELIFNAWIIALHELAPGACIVGTNGPIRLGEEDEPEPDIYIRPSNLPLTELHGPESLLVVEIASTSHAHDFGRKVPQYARFRVPELWIIDAIKRVTVVYREPDPEGTWGSVTRHRETERLSPAALPGLSFRLADYPAPEPAAEG